MNVSPAADISSLALGITGAGERSPASSGTFSKIVQGFINDPNTQQVQADNSVELLATGQSDSIHATMLALTTADLSLRVFMEVRNKVIDAYQEVMRMQL